MIAEMELFFRAERAWGIAVMLLGVVMLMLSLYLWRIYRQPLGYGLMIPFMLIALLGLGLGPNLVASSNQNIAEFRKLLKEDRAAFVAKELPRIQKINANWIRLKLIWAALILLSLVAVLAVKKEFWVGLALGGLLAGSAFMAIDIVAQKRAVQYQAQIQAAQR